MGGEGPRGRGDGILGACGCRRGGELDDADDTILDPGPLPHQGRAPARGGAAGHGGAGPAGEGPHGGLASPFPGRIDRVPGRSVGFTGGIRRALGTEKDAAEDFEAQLEEQVAQELGALIERSGADEVLVTTSAYDRAALLESFERLARLAGLSGRG